MQDLDFDRVYAEYFNEVYRFAFVLCRNPEQAEELTQEAFFKALRNIHKFRGGLPHKQLVVPDCEELLL